MKILLWGGQSKARVIIEMIYEIYTGASIIGIFDKTLKRLPFNTNVKLYSEKADLNDLCNEATHFVVCIGGEHGFARFSTANKLREKGLKPLSLVSQHGLLDKLDYCGEGVQVMPGATAHKFTSIGKYCILNTNSTVDHECKLGDGVHVMGGVSIAGRVQIGDYSKRQRLMFSLFPTLENSRFEKERFGFEFDVIWDRLSRNYRHDDFSLNANARIGNILHRGWSITRAVFELVPPPDVLGSKVQQSRTLNFSGFGFLY